MRRLTVRAILLAALPIIIMLFLPTAPQGHAQTGSAQYSTVSISPAKTCCRQANVPYQQGQNFNVTVMLNLLAGESFNAFDVRINYTNPHEQTTSGQIPGVLQAMSIDYSHNIFANSSYPSNVLTACIDGNVYGSVGNAQGCAGDYVGQVHLAEVLLGPHNITGPLTGQLFTINFLVWGPGYSALAPDSTQFVTPGSFSFIPIQREDGVFGNQGVVAFFTYQPDYGIDTTVSPVLLENNPILFEASPFVANNSAMSFRSYKWNFGDGNTTTRLSPIIDHTFAASKNYTVTLTVTDIANEVANFSRTVSVLPAFATLSLTVDDRSGTPQNHNVQVSIFNNTSAQTPFNRTTINQIGGATFRNLIPGDYYLTFSGSGLVSSSKTERVIGGMTNYDTVYMSGIPQSPDYAPLVYLGTILGGAGAITGAIIYRKRRPSNSSDKNRVRSLRKPKSKFSH